jgi:isoprenylcysteine carboxyl methyltransferase (ICMT) family protein YpbQ
MSTKFALKILFSCIFLTLLGFTGWAGARMSVLQWGGLTTGPDRYWTIATLMDAYFGFLTFYVWVHFKESRWMPRIAWFIAIMLLGNMAMSAYVLLQLARLRPDQGASAILTRNRGNPQ